MSLDSISHTAPASSWHSIRPWAPSLALAVREVTSVSATFILSSNLAGQDVDPSLASLALEAAGETDEEMPSGASGECKPSSVIADSLAKGLSVSVNGSAWPRAFIRIDDELDEAVIIIYALMPGRQYDIELGLAHGGQLQRQVTTEEHPDEIHSDPESPTMESSSDPHSTPSTSPSRTVPGTPPTATPQITLEDRLNQLQHNLSVVNQERETLLASLKSARRDAQKADAALRSEIDTLKRTSEKNSAAELRGKQKVLALQEAVKRAQNATKETEEMALQVESEVPGLTKRKEEKEAEHMRMKAQADKVRKERCSLEEKERKKMDAMRAELTGLTNKLERLGGKREKLEKTVIPDLEEKLRSVAQEIEQEEEALANLEMEEQREQAHPVPFERPRHHSGPGPIGRPSAVQRPNGDLAQSTSTQLWTPTHPHRPVHPHHGQSHNPKSHSFHHHPPTLLINPHRRASLRTNDSSNSSGSNLSSSVSAPAVPSAATTSSHSSPGSTSLTSSPSPTRTSPVHAPGMSATSTLSSRAPAFEPSRSIKTGMNGHGHSAPVPIQRPSVSQAVGSGRPTVGRSGSVGHGLAHGGRGHGH